MATPGPDASLQLLTWIAAALFFTEGIALSLGARWAFRLGIPLGWRTERLDVVVPEGVEGDLSDDIDRLHAFDLEDYRSASGSTPAGSARSTGA